MPIATAPPAAEGTVDWKAAEDYMRGKPEGDESDATGEDTADAAGPKEFRYRGKTVTVDPETYAVLEDLRKEARGGNGRLGSELARTRERLAKVEGLLTARPIAEPNAPDIQPPDPKLATTDIVAWQRQMEAFHEAKMDRLRTDLETKYVDVVHNADRQMKEQAREKEWADSFYESFDHLDNKHVKPIVSQAYIENREEIESLRAVDNEAAYERLAELTDAKLVALRGKPDTTPNRRPPRVESAAGPTPRSKSEEPARDFTAASWVAKARAKMSGREDKGK